jgi:hypothetical protein
MNSEIPALSRVEMQQRPDFLAYLLLFQNGLIKGDLSKIIFPFLFQLSDRQSILTEKEVKTLFDTPEKLKAILQKIKLENSANNLLKDSIVFDPKNHGSKKSFNEQLEAWVSSRLKENAQAKKEQPSSNKEHLVTKKENQLEQRDKQLNSLDEKTSNPDQSKNDKRSPIEKQFQNRNFQEKNFLGKEEIKDRGLPIKTPLKEVFSSEKAPKETAQMPNERAILQEKADFSKNVINFSQSQEKAMENKEATKFPSTNTANSDSNEAKTIKNGLIQESKDIRAEVKDFGNKQAAALPQSVAIPEMKQNKIENFLNKSLRRFKKVQKKENAQNDLFDDEEVKYSQQEDDDL